MHCGRTTGGGGEPVTPRSDLTPPRSETGNLARSMLGGGGMPSDRSHRTAMATPPPYPLDDARSDRSHHHRVPHSPRGDDRLPSDRSHHQRNISMDGIESNPLFAGYLPPRSEVTHPSLRGLPNSITPACPASASSDSCTQRLTQGHEPSRAVSFSTRKSFSIARRF